MKIIPLRVKVPAHDDAKTADVKRRLTEIIRAAIQDAFPVEGALSLSDAPTVHWSLVDVYEGPETKVSSGPRKAKP
jgi:hypothetical protein